MRIGSFTLTAGAALLSMALLAASPTKAEEPLVLARDGYFYVGGRVTTIDGKSFVTDQMYVEVRIPAKQTKPFPVVMVHGGTMSGTNFTGTPDGREGWAQHFVRQGYAVYVVDQVGKARSGYLAQANGPQRSVERDNSQPRFVNQAKYKMWPQAHLHTQWPGSGEPDDPVSLQLAFSQLPGIANFSAQQPLNRDALIKLFEKVGPGILLVHSQSGTFGWAVADNRPDLIKALVAIEPNGPPVRAMEFVGAPNWFKEGGPSLTYGITSAPLNYVPAVSAPSELKWVKEDKPDGPDLVTCWKQAEPARQLPNLQKMPILIVMAEASYHAPYDHCTVKFLNQAGVKPTFIKLADIGIRGNSHVLIMEKNNKEIAAVLMDWLDKAMPASR